MQGYENARKEGEKLGLDVFFGWEFTLNPYAADFLTYNLDKEFLLDHPYIDRLSLEEYSKLVRKNGGLLIHAHPYREAEYIHYPPILSLTWWTGLRLTIPCRIAPATRTTWHGDWQENIPV